MNDELVQLFVRTEKGAIFGPLSPTSVELLIDNGIVAGRVQISFDGLNYVFPGRVPGVRMVIPRALWGDVVAPGEAEDAAWSNAVLPPQVAEPYTSSPSVFARSAVPGSAAVPAGSIPGAPVASSGSIPGRPVSPAGSMRVAPMASSGSVPGRPVSSLGSIPGAPVASSAPPAGSRVPVASSAPGVIAGPGVRTQNQPARPQSPPAFTPGPPVLAALAAPSAPPWPPPGLNDLSRPPSNASEIFEGGASLTGEEIAPTGALSAVSPIRLYFLAAATNRHGLLTLELADRTIQIHFRKGTPEFVDSNHLDDGLSAFLVKRNLLTAEVIAQAEPQRSRFGGELLPTLFALGQLNPNTVFQHLGQRAGDVILRALCAEQGQYTWQAVELAPAKAMPMGHKWSVLFEQLRRVPAADVRRRIMPALDLPVMKGQGLIVSTDLKLSPHETRALNHFDGVRSLNQLAAKLPAEAETMLRTAWMLQFCDVVSFAAAVLKNPGPSSPKTDPIAASAAPAPHARPSEAPCNPVLVPAVQSVAYPATKPKGPPVVTDAAAPGPPQLRPAGPPSVATTGAMPGPPQLRPSGSPPVATTGAVPGPPPQLRPAGSPQVATTTAAAMPGPPQLKPAGSPSAVNASSPSSVTRRQPQVMAAPSPVAGPAAGAAEMAGLTQTIERMRAQNFFDVLGVAKEADASAVKIAYFKLAKSSHPDTVPPGTHEDIAKLKADIFALVGDAHRTLSDAKLRDEYTKEVNAGGSGEKVDIAKILRAEEYFQKGVILTRARKFPEAVKMLSDAIDASDIEGEYYAWRGWAKFFTFSDKKEGRTEALKDIALCMKKNPNVAAMYYFQGFMAKVLGDMGAAKTNFTKAIQLDPRHIDAQRELRMMK